MSYIGKSPAVGNFVKLDAISTSSTNTYNLTVDSVAFVPESANHMLVSLNGVIQAPLSSFSVSGSTITFLPASGTLSSSDSIDFIMVYGNVLDIGTPSDATVTNAKTNFVSTSSSAGLQIKGDNTTAGTLQLNCEQNSHGIKLRSPSHSASASYTLTFPTTDGNADEFLQTNGSGVLTWASAGGSGRILQIVSSSDTTQRSTSSTSYGEHSNTLSVDITPASTSSTILLLLYTNGYITSDAGSMFFTIYRDIGGTVSDLGNSNKGLTNIKNAGNVHTSIVPTSISTFDTPSTTSQVNYALNFRAGSGTAYINYNSSRSRLTALEIGA